MQRRVLTISKASTVFIRIPDNHITIVNPGDYPRTAFYWCGSRYLDSHWSYPSPRRMHHVIDLLNIPLDVTLTSNFLRPTIKQYGKIHSIGIIAIPLNLSISPRTLSSTQTRATTRNPRRLVSALHPDSNTT